MNNKTTLLAALAALMLDACPKDNANQQRPPKDAGRSPNATLRPSPPSSLSPSVGLIDAGFEGSVGVPADSKGRIGLRELGVSDPTPFMPATALRRDHLAHRELQGATLTAKWLWYKVPEAPTGVAEVNAAGIKAARKASQRTWRIEVLDSGRMRVIFDSPSFPLTKFTELRARSDHFGHIMVWPNTEVYRVIPPGALRALLNERRVDASSLVVGRTSASKSVKPRFGFPTLQTSLTTPWGKIVLDQARTTNVGTGGPLLCRMLLEIVGIHPESSVCRPNSVPVRAHFVWKSGGTIGFEVESLLMRSDFPGSLFAVPPPRAKFTDQGLPPNGSAVFLTLAQMRAFRNRATEPEKPRTDPEAEGAPGEGFIAVNHTDALRYMVVDGVAVAWVPARGEQYVIGSKNGRYNVQWRSFLGTEIGETKEVRFPARLSLGEAFDGGAAAGAAGGQHP